MKRAVAALLVLALVASCQQSQPPLALTSASAAVAHYQAHGFACSGPSSDVSGLGQWSCQEQVARTELPVVLDGDDTDAIRQLAILATLANSSDLYAM